MHKQETRLLINQLLKKFVDDFPEKGLKLIEDTRNKKKLPLKEMLEEMEKDTDIGIDFKRAFIKKVYTLNTNIIQLIEPDNILFTKEDLKLKEVPEEIKKLSQDEFLRKMISMTIYVLFL